MLSNEIAQDKHSTRDRPKSFPKLAIFWKIGEIAGFYLVKWIIP